MMLQGHPDYEVYKKVADIMLNHFFFNEYATSEDGSEEPADGGEENQEEQREAEVNQPERDN